ncbi:MAG: hypothetical protein ACYDBB_22050 [Armatimonadota bacterium]
MTRILCVISLFVLLVAASELNAQAQAPKGAVPLTGEAAKIVATEGAGCRYIKDTCSVTGRLFEGRCIFYHDYGSKSGWSTFDIRGWDRFVGYAAIIDGSGGETKGELTVEIDGQEVASYTLHEGNKAILIDIPLTGHQTLRLQGKNGRPMVVEPRLIRGERAFTTIELQRMLIASVDELMMLRASAKEGKNQAIVDHIEGCLLKMGIVIIETPQGATWKLK